MQFSGIDGVFGEATCGTWVQGQFAAFMRAPMQASMWLLASQSNNNTNNNHNHNNSYEYCCTCYIHVTHTDNSDAVTWALSTLPQSHSSSSSTIPSPQRFAYVSGKLWRQMPRPWARDCSSVSLEHSDHFDDWDSPLHVVKTWSLLSPTVIVIIITKKHSTIRNVAIWPAYNLPH